MGTAGGKEPRAGSLRAFAVRQAVEASTPLRLGGAVFLGVLVAVSPFYGLQMLIVLALAALFRLNKLAALAAVQLSIPPVYAVLVVASLETGNFLLRGQWIDREAHPVPRTMSQAWRLLEDLGGTWLLGSLVVGVALGVLAGSLAFFVASLRQDDAA